MRGVDGICSKARPSEFTSHTRFVEKKSTVTVSWPIVPLKVMMQIHFEFPGITQMVQ